MNQSNDVTLLDSNLFGLLGGVAGEFGFLRENLFLRPRIESLFGLRFLNQRVDPLLVVRLSP
jgi:hypothetical protein